MFGNLKKKLGNVLQESIVIGDSLQQQLRERISTPSTPATPTFEENSQSTRISSSFAQVELGIPAHLNMAAGCELLAQYEESWKNIHDMNEHNAQQATEIAAKIESAAARSQMQQTALKQLNATLAALPALKSQLQQSMQTLQQVTALTTVVEQKFEQLENLCEECALQDYMLQKQFELSQHKQQKMTELECYRQKVAAEQQQRIRQNEERLRQMQRERQAVFENAFHEDVQQFKQNGALPTIARRPSHQQVDLEAVVLDDSETKDALEQFLNG